MGPPRAVISQAKTAWGFGPFSVSVGRAAKRVSDGHFCCYGDLGGDVDTVARLIALLLFILSCTSAHAYKAVTEAPVTVYTCTGYQGQKAESKGSPAGACSAVLPPQLKVGSPTAWDYRLQDYRLAGCDLAAKSCTYESKSTYPNCSNCGGGTWGLSGAYFYTEQLKVECPQNSTRIGTTNQCECDSGYMPGAANKCVQYTCPPSGSYSAVTQPDQKVANAGDTLCTGGCSYTPSSWKVGQDGQIWATWPYKSSGSFCQGNKDTTGASTGEKNTSNPAPVPCGTNQCPGTVNGATVCVPCKGQQEKGPETAASSPSGSASSATGSSTTTECNGVTCTTTTTTKDGSGNVTGVVEKTEKQESFCKENPQSSLCKPSSFGGACAATTCEGDAVMCAIARETYKRNCEWYEDPAAEPLKQSGTSAMNGELKPEGHPGASPELKDISFASAIDQSDAIGGAACPADKSVSLGGASLTIPFSQLCSPLQMLGRVLVALAMLAAVAIVFRG